MAGGSGCPILKLGLGHLQRQPGGWCDLFRERDGFDGICFRVLLPRNDRKDDFDSSMRECFLTGLEFWYNQFFSICIFEFFCSRESCFLIPAILLVVNRN